MITDTYPPWSSFQLRMPVSFVRTSSSRAAARCLFMSCPRIHSTVLTTG